MTVQPELSKALKVINAKKKKTIDSIFIDGNEDVLML